MAIARSIGVLCAALFMGGCESVEGLRPDIAAKPVPSRFDETAYINDLRKAFVFRDTDAPVGGETLIGCYTGERLQAFKSKFAEGYSRGYPEEDTPPRAQGKCVFFRDFPADDAGQKAVATKYLAAGFGLTDIYCQRFFTVVTASAQNRKFGRTFANGVDTLVGSILTLGAASKSAIGITNSGFGLIDTTFQGYDDAYLVAPDMANVRKLVLAAQNEYRQNSFNQLPGSYQEARSVVERYAGLCTFPGMRQLVNDSIAEKTTKTEANTNAPRTTQQQGSTIKNVGSPLAPQADRPAVPVPPTTGPKS